MTVFFDDYYNTGIGSTPLPYGGEEVGFIDAFVRSLETQMMGSNTDSMTELMTEELQPLIDQMNENLDAGIVDGPERSWYEPDLGFENPGHYFSIFDETYEKARISKLEEVFNHLRKYPDLYPEYADYNEEKLTENIKNKALELMKLNEEVSQRSSTSGTIGSFSGSLAGVATDKGLFEVIEPLSYAEIFYGSGKQKLSQLVLKEGILGAGAEAILQTDIKDWYNSLGLQYTYEDFFKAVAAGGILGAAFPVGVRGVTSGIRLTRDQIRKGFEAFKGRGIDPKEADVQINALDNLDDLESPDGPGGPVIPFEAARDETGPRTIDLDSTQWERLDDNNLYVNQIYNIETINNHSADEVFMANPPKEVQPLQFSENIDPIVNEARINQPFNTLDRLYEIAPIFQAKLENSGRIIAKELKIKFKSPGLKNKKTSAEKIKRRSLSSPNQLSDVVRSGFIVTTARQADEVVAKLSKTFDVIDEGWQLTSLGYFDRKVVIKNDDGLLGEVQIWPKKLLEAKDSKGHALYEKHRSSTNDAEREQLEIEMQSLYEKALSKENQSFATLLGILNDPNRLANLRLKAASPDMTAAELATSDASTATQSPPGSKIATADRAAPGGRERIAGRPSQDVNTGSAKEPLDITPPFVDSISRIEERIAKTAKAQINMEKGNLPDDDVSTTSRRPAPKETEVVESDVDNFVDQVAKDTDFDNLSDDEIINVDLIIDDQVVSKTLTGAEIKKELAQEQQMIDRLRGCVV